MSDHRLNLEQHCRKSLLPPNGHVEALQLAVSCRLLNCKTSDQLLTQVLSGPINTAECFNQHLSPESQPLD